MRVLLAMLGGRRRYIVPEIMEELGVLGCFVTDAFVGKHPRLAALLGAVGRGLNVRGLRALAGRRASRLSNTRVVPFQWLGLRYALANRARAPGDVALFASVNRHFCLRAIPYLESMDVCWAYNGAAQELFEAARAKGVRCVLEQVSAPRQDERHELEQAEKDWPRWCAPAERMSPIASDALWQRERAEWQLADVIVAGSRFVQSCLQRSGVAKDRCIVCPSGIDLERFAVGDETRNAGPLRVLFVGHINLQKGAPYLLEAVRRLNSRSIQLKMVGSWQATRERLDEFAAWAEFAGPVPPTDIVSEYHWADVLVVPSVCEGSAMVTYEARSCGLPIIATPNAGAAFTPGVDGLEIPVRDTEAIASILDRLARNRQDVRRLREGAIANRDALGRDAYRERIRHVLEIVAGDAPVHAGAGRRQAAPMKEDQYGA